MFSYCYYKLTTIQNILFILILVLFCFEKSSSTPNPNTLARERGQRLNQNLIPRIEKIQGTKEGIECSYLFDERTFYGNMTSLGNYESRQLTSFDRKIQSVLIKNNCSLTLFDSRGRRKVIQEDKFTLNRWNKKAKSGCCECSGCEGLELRIENEHPLPFCAKIFQESKCSICRGWKNWVGIGEEQAEMILEQDDQISSIFVRNRCQFLAYKEKNFQGSSQIFNGTYDYLPMEWINQISSFKCICHR